MQETPDLETIRQKVFQVVVDNLPDARLENLTEKTPLFQLGLSSLNAISLVLGLEEAFKLQFDLETDVDFLNFRSTASILALVKRKLNVQEEPSVEA